MPHARHVSVRFRQSLCTPAVSIVFPQWLALAYVSDEFVMTAELAELASWISRDNGVFRYVARDDRARPDDREPAYVYAADYCRIRTNTCAATHDCRSSGNIAIDQRVQVICEHSTMSDKYI